MKSKHLLKGIVNSIRGVQSFLYHRFLFRIRRVLPYLIIGLGIFVVLKFIYQNVFYVKTMSINSIPKSQIIEQGIKDEMDQILGTNIILLNTGEIIRSIKVKFPQVQQINIIKELPNTLIISTKLILPKYYLVSHQKYYSIDDTNKIFDLTEQNEYPNIPQVTYLNSLSLELGKVFHEFDSSQIDEIAAIDWSSFETELRNISFSTYFGLTIFDNKFNYLFHIYLDSKFDQTQILEIMTLLQNGEYRVKKYSEIDLRFDKAVIRYQ